MDPIDTTFCRALNHVLAAHGWARQRLAPFAGATLSIAAPPLPAVGLEIRADGLVRAAGPGAVAALEVTVRPGALLALPRGLEHALRDVAVSGNEQLAAQVLFLLRHLRWDVEEDLSRVVGDVLAQRMVGGTRDLAAALADAGQRVAGALMEYAVEEHRLVVDREEHAAFARTNAALRDAIERLDKRLGQLGDG